MASSIERSIAVDPVTTLTAQTSEQDTGSTMTPAHSGQSPTNSIRVGHPTEQLEVDNEADREASPADPEDNIVYPTGLKLWLACIAVYTTFFLNGLDLTIVAVAVPRLTDYFGKVDDIGWYSAAYGMSASAFVPFFGKACTIFRVKSIILFGLTFFATGSAICTFANQSATFILGRAVAGFGLSAFSSSGFTLLVHSFPKHKRSLYLGIAGASQSVGLSCAPILGGVLIDAFDWRACFGVNLVLCPLVIVFTYFCADDPVRPGVEDSSWREKLFRLDLIGTALILPCVTCLLMALQWGGIKYGWSNYRIILLLVLFVGLASSFLYLQHRLGENATIPLRIAKKRDVLAAMWFAACCSGTLAITEYFTNVYWQGVRGQSPTTSGLLGMPMILGLSIGAIIAGFGINLVGYYTPFMLTTSFVAPIASGFLTTLDPEESKAKVVVLLGILGLAVGLGLNSPSQAMAAIFSPHEVSMAYGLIGFASGLASALFISCSATLFQNRLAEELKLVTPNGTDLGALEHAGLSDIRRLIGQDQLKDVLTGYNRATVQTLYMPLGLAVLTIVGSAAMRWESVKKKRD